MDYDIIIIGAGAAGLMVAVGAAGEGRKVMILEKMPRPARKMMITGKGRCNFTNLKQWNEFSRHIHPRPDLLKPAFYNLSSEKMIEFLNANGVESVVERGDRVFPASYLASDVVDALVRAVRHSGTEIRCNATVEELLYTGQSVTCGDAGTSFSLKCSDGCSYSCRKVIICTGGLSYPATGSTGDGYRWATELGHSIRPLFPSLTAVVPTGYKMEGPQSSMSDLRGHIDRTSPLSESGRYLCGNHLKNVGLELLVDGNVVQEEFGDIDFTDGGLEGPLGFKISRKCVNALINGSKVSVLLDLKPAVEIDALEMRLKTLWDEICRDKRNAARQYGERFKVLLAKVMPSSLIQAFLKANPRVDHKSLAVTLKKWRIEIAGYVGYERCVVTAGGINAKEIFQKTMESRLVPGLFFAGEILDLDADTGGYNLQTAFSTGYLAGIAAAKSLQ